jgi:uncharacterized membrane protein YqjE
VNAAQPPPGEQMDTGERSDQPQNIAAAIAEISERATLLVREEIELAKVEVSEKATKLVKGAVVGVAAGVFFMTALVFALVGCAWLLYYYLPIGNDYTYFWGFFAMAVILVVFGVIAGLGRSPGPGPRTAHRRDRRLGRLPVCRARGGGELMAQRSPAEIRSSIEANRMELAVSVANLRGEVARLTDWRAHVERHRSEITVGAAVVGLMLGARMVRRRRRKRS